jgi:Fe-S oxidoreductase
VRIDIPWLNENLAQRLNQKELPAPLRGTLGSVTGAATEDRSAPISKIFFGNYHYFAKWGTRFSSISNLISGDGKKRHADADGEVKETVGTMRRLMERWLGLDQRRALPAFPKQTLVQAARQLAAPSSKGRDTKVVVFADVFTNYGMTKRGVATIEVLRGLGADVVVSESVPEGRAALSQGMIATAKQHARRAALELDSHVSDGRDIVVVEPSSLSMFRRDFSHLLDSKERFERFRSRAFEPVEYVVRMLAKSGRTAQQVFDISKSKVGYRLFFHAHCQQKTIGCEEPTLALFRELGFDVVTSNVECCGMAGSFGYKKDFYDLSMAVGADLFGQVVQQDRNGGARQLVASGTSCTEQLQAGFDRSVVHPMEILASLLEIQESTAKLEEEDKELESDVASLKRGRKEVSKS